MQVRFCPQRWAETRKSPSDGLAPIPHPNFDSGLMRHAGPHGCAKPLSDGAACGILSQAA
jgi:hypothetical protein